MGRQNADGRPIRHGELLPSLDFIDGYDEGLKRVNEGKVGGPFRIAGAHVKSSVFVRFLFQTGIDSSRSSRGLSQIWHGAAVQGAGGRSPDGRAQQEEEGAVEAIRKREISILRPPRAGIPFHSSCGWDED